MNIKRLVLRTPDFVKPIQVSYDDSRKDLSLSVMSGNRTSHYAWCPEDSALKAAYKHIQSKFDEIPEYSCICLNSSNKVEKVEDAKTFFGEPQPDISKDPYEDWRKLMH